MLIVALFPVFDIRLTYFLLLYGYFMQFREGGKGEKTTMEQRVAMWRAYVAKREKALVDTVSKFDEATSQIQKVFNFIQQMLIVYMFSIYISSL